MRGLEFPRKGEARCDVSTHFPDVHVFWEQNDSARGNIIFGAVLNLIWTRIIVKVEKKKPLIGH